jgi:hypothetical protein
MTERVAIVGGGITGLFCALVLARQNKAISLFEATERLGGRIRTIRLNKNNEELSSEEWTNEKLEFCVEFGPMRFELKKQLLLKALLTYLGILEKSEAEKKGLIQPGQGVAYLESFSDYASPESPYDPKYHLRPEEENKSPLQLLRLGLLRIMLHLEVREGDAGFVKRHPELIEDVKLAAATQEPVEPVFNQWMKNLRSQDHWDIQTRGHIDGVPLYALGFYNLLSDYLSHDAIVKVRDLGTFYHMLPENPNAAEWLVWFLIGLCEPLEGIFGGSECIIDNLKAELKGSKTDRQPGSKAKVNIHTGCLVKGIRVAVENNDKTENNDKKYELQFDSQKRTDAALADAESGFDRVILALPEAPLKKIVAQSTEAFGQEPDIEDLLDSAFGFPMVKTFVVVKNRWWEEKNRANRFATRIPTRELHYWKGHTQESTQGLIMAYTDRPATAFWANYLPSGKQDDVNAGKLAPCDSGYILKLWRQGNANTGRLAPLSANLLGRWRVALHNTVKITRMGMMPLPKTTLKRLIKKVVQYVNDTNESNAPDITRESIVWYGIRDWGREPFQGANHAWRPERRYWTVMSRLADIPLQGTKDAKGIKNAGAIHICGEAYSDYHGFIEGSLRSATYVLHRILDNPGERESALSWLTAALEELNKNYFDSLKHWVESLDEEKARNESFIYQG